MDKYKEMRKRRIDIDQKPRSGEWFDHEVVSGCEHWKSVSKEDANLWIKVGTNKRAYDVRVRLPKAVLIRMLAEIQDAEDRAVV